MLNPPGSPEATANQTAYAVAADAICPALSWRSARRLGPGYDLIPDGFAFISQAQEGGGGLALNDPVCAGRAASPEPASEVPLGLA
jgi:hypothetical protein